MLRGYVTVICTFLSIHVMGVYMIWYFLVYTYNVVILHVSVLFYLYLQWGYITCIGTFCSIHVTWVYCMYQYFLIYTCYVGKFSCIGTFCIIHVRVLSDLYMLRGYVTVIGILWSIHVMRVYYMYGFFWFLHIMWVYYMFRYFLIYTYYVGKFHVSIFSVYYV